MLVLTRKNQEQIKIGNDVTITIVRIKGNTVRVGIDAPKHVPVNRGEVAVQQTPDAADAKVKPLAPSTSKDADGAKGRVLQSNAAPSGETVLPLARVDGSRDDLRIPAAAV